MAESDAQKAKARGRAEAIFTASEQRDAAVHEQPQPVTTEAHRIARDESKEGPFLALVTSDSVRLGGHRLRLLVHRRVALFRRGEDRLGPPSRLCLLRVALSHRNLLSNS